MWEENRDFTKKHGDTKGIQGDSWWCIYIYVYYTLLLFNIAMENGPFIDDFPLKPPFISIYEGFSMAMLNNQMVTNKNNLCVCVWKRGNQSQCSPIQQPFWSRKKWWTETITGVCPRCPSPWSFKSNMEVSLNKMGTMLLLRKRVL